MPESQNEIDINQDGLISKKEEIMYERKAVNRRRMAWLALIALIASGISILFFVPEARLKSLSGILELYFVALGSVVGAYVGISTWMSKR